MTECRTVADGNRSNVRRTPGGVVIATLEQDVIVDWDGIVKDGWKSIEFHTWISETTALASGQVGELDVHEGSGAKVEFKGIGSGDYTARTCVTVGGWISGERIEAIERE